MNSFQQQDNAIGPVHNSILSVAKIAGIAAVISLAGSLVGAVATFFKPVSTEAMPAKEGLDEASMQQLAQGFTYISIFMSLAISGLAFYFLFRFSTLAKISILGRNPNKLTQALQSLAGYFKIWGIIMFLIIALFVMSLIGGILGGIFGG